MSDNRDFLKDLLLEDYRYRAEALRHSEQAGETRVNIFLGLVTLVAGVLATLSAAEHGPDADSLRVIFGGALVVLVVVGVLTLMRLLTRNKRTDECKHDLDHIRQVYKDLFDQDGLLSEYYPTGKPRPTPVGRARSFGGLVHLMASLNGLLVAGAVFVFLVPMPPSGKIDLAAAKLLLPFAAASVTFLVVLGLQSLYVAHKEGSYKDKLCPSIPTHAGGVVYKSEGNETLYLIISTRDNQESMWVLPKGHIESGEGDGEAALREVREETGVVAQLMRPLGEVSFSVMTDGVEIHARAKFYLMRWLFNVSEKRSEGRELQWLPFEQALKQLTFPEGKRILLLAYAKNTR